MAGCETSGLSFTALTGYRLGHTNILQMLEQLSSERQRLEEATLIIWERMLPAISFRLAKNLFSLSKTLLVISKRRSYCSLVSEATLASPLVYSGRGG